ncbi:hypothetical protein GE543_02105 [Pseudomonas sp. SZ57]|uniref:hypothetical protein n=1 Tax=Pseudomonas sp. SZ57 TaxID=2662259 RepID=UPI0012911474|nr:hypothetical protein [Pseudomonas sp. SZ57]MQQ33171.1 hypothetical protein [Pseudomonas sp. SZ57]
MNKHVKNSRYWLATTHPGQKRQSRCLMIKVYRVASKIARPDATCHQPLSGSLSLQRIHLPALAEIDNPAD